MEKPTTVGGLNGSAEKIIMPIFSEIQAIKGMLENIGIVLLNRWINIR